MKRIAVPMLGGKISPIQVDRAQIVMRVRDVPTVELTATVCGSSQTRHRPLRARCSAAARRGRSK